MARSITLRNLNPIQVDPAADPQPIPLWNSARGVDLETSLSRLGPDGTPFAKNFRLTVDGRLRVRGGLAAVGSVAAAPITGIVVASTNTGLDYHVRVLTNGVQILTGTNWGSCSGPAFTMAEYDYVEFASWNGKLMFNVPGSGLYELNLSTQAYTHISTAPIGRHMTVFGGRVIISNIAGAPTRVQWSTKNSNTDWTGIGSGSDDMLSAPGGVVDIQHGVFPLSDSEAVLVRSSSIWILTLTGNPDAPFAFNYRFNEGTDSPASIVRLTNQRIAMIGREDIVIISVSGIESIGLPIRKEVLGTAYSPVYAVGAFDSKSMEYRLHVPPTAASTSSDVWRYKFTTQTWHKDTWPCVVRRLASGNAQIHVSTNQLTGKTNELVGPTNLLGVLGRQGGLLVAQSGGYVCRETDTGTTDLTTAGGTQVVPAEIWSGLIQPKGSLHRLHMLSVQIEYVADRTIDLTLEVSTDGGTTWEGYGSVSLLTSIVPTVGIFRRSIEKRQMMLRLVAADAVGLELIAVNPFVLPGAPIHL